MIRKLELRDLPYMYEWMQDEEVTANLQADFANCERIEMYEADEKVFR